MGVKPWEVSDAFWARVEPPIPPPPERDPGRPHKRAPGAGRKRKPARLVFEAMVYVLRKGCQLTVRKGKLRLRRRKRAKRPGPTGGKNGSKRHLLVDGRGGPLSIVVTGADRHDASQIDAVLAAARRPRGGGGCSACARTLVPSCNQTTL